METNFYEGTWEAEELNEESNGFAHVIIKEPGVSIGVYGPCFVNDNKDERLSMERKLLATTSLVSAAPDLLYALDNILKRYELHCPDEYYKDDAVAEAEDAIKKALGESDSE